MASPLMKPFSLTYVRYPDNDLVGKLMAVASLMPVSVVVCTFGAFFARRELWDLLTLVGVLCNEILAQTLKHVVKEPRPPSCAAVDFCKTYGMPSSHAQLATFAATLATLHLHRRRVGSPPPAAAAAGTSPGRFVDPLSALLVGMTWPVAAAVGMSRVYLGYHTSAQVLVGSVVGVAFGYVWHLVCCGCARAFEGRCEEGGGGGGGGGGGLTGFAVRFVGMRDSSLVADPLAVERKAIRDAAKKTTKKTK